MALGELVRTLRQDRGWKQQELARRTGLPQGTISGIELNKHKNPTQDTLTRLAGAFDLSLAEFLQRAAIAPDLLGGTFNLPPEVDPAWLESFLHWSRFLTSRQRQAILDLVRTLGE